MLYGRVQAALYGGKCMLHAGCLAVCSKGGQHLQRAVYLQGGLQVAICDEAGYLYDCVMIQVQSCTGLSVSDLTNTDDLPSFIQ